MPWLGGALLVVGVAAALWLGTRPSVWPEAGSTRAVEDVATAVSEARLQGVRAGDARPDRVVQPDREAPKAERSALVPLRPEVADAPLGVRVLVVGTGEFYVHLQVELSKDGIQTADLLAGATNPRILVVDPVEGEPPPVHTVAFDLAAVQRAIDRLR